MDESSFPLIGDVFVGRYRIERVLGSGGFAQVYHATQIELGREVAIKVLKPVTDPTKSAEERAAKFEVVARRFDREAKLVSRLKDRNTVMMHDYGRTDDGLLFMVLEYVDGVTVNTLLDEHGAGLPPRRVVKILRQILTSLQEAHSLGILHRDIKPANIMVYEHVGRADQVKVLDFGIAKTVDRAVGEPERGVTSSDVTADDTLVGTPRYMSPEQIRGRTLAPGSDIYSVGLVAYELLVGVRAIQEDSSLSIIARHLDVDPIELPRGAVIPPRLVEVVDRMLLKDPAGRYQRCGDVLRDLGRWDDDDVAEPRNDPTATVSNESALFDATPEPARVRGGRPPLAGLIALGFAITATAFFVTIAILDDEGPDRPMNDATDSPPTEPVSTLPLVPDESPGESKAPEVAQVGAERAEDVTDDSVARAQQDGRQTGEAPEAGAESDDASAEIFEEREKTPRPTQRKKPRKPRRSSEVSKEKESGLKLFGVE